MTTMSKRLTPEELKTLKRLKKIMADPWVKRMMAGKPRTRRQARTVGRKKAAREAAAFWRARLQERRAVVKHLAYDSPAMRQRRRRS